MAGRLRKARGRSCCYDKQLDGAEYRDVCKQHRSFCYDGLDSTSTNESTFHAVGPNAVSSITFPLGGTVAPGSPLTIQVKLVRPARPGGEVVEWDVVPANSFSQASGSGTTFNPTVHNRVNVAAGDQLKQITVEFVSPPAGCRETCSGQVNTRMVNFNLDQLPYLRTGVFSMRTK